MHAQNWPVFLLWVELWPRWTMDEVSEGRKVVMRRRCIDMAQMQGLLWCKGYGRRERRRITDDLLAMQDEALKVLNEK